MKLSILLTAFAATLAGATVQARPAQCLLLVDGKTYINGTCNFESGVVKDGSFTIGTDDPKSKHFAYVNVAFDEGEGFWNGNPPESHAHESLGKLTHNGACWVNTRAIVCAWAK